MKSILVAGGAGYIGSHTVKELIKQKYSVIIYDNLSSGHKWAVDKKAKLVVGDLLDTKKLEDTLKKFKPQAVIHFAGVIEVGESVENPHKYYINNVVGTLSLLEAMINAKVHNIVFSSSAAVYGNPVTTPIKESDLKEPTNPYGHTKKIIEDILYDYSVAYGINSVSLRYFNAAGADKTGDIGESHNPETHLIPRVLNSLIEEEEIGIFGCSYKTSDGTCLRDYIHVDDLAQAHILAIKYLKSNKGKFAFNLGSGAGFTVKEVIKSAENVTNKKAKISVKPRRQGDPTTLLADITKAKKELRWSPKYSDIDYILETAWHWEQNKK
ncbi:UDP-glucose 4-epimerase GalE [bacterium]|nr:UDP-glucose 4-epimerase GalE [bacterium]